MVQGYTNLSLGLEQGQGHILIFPGRMAYVTQGRWISLSNTAYSMYTMVYNASQIQNDQIDYWVWLSKGTYTLSLWQTLGNMGICTYYLDGSSLGSIDWYSGSASYGYRQEITGILVATSGRKVFSIKVTNKNASSSYYYACLHSMAFYRTA